MTLLLMQERATAEDHLERAMQHDLDGSDRESGQPAYYTPRVPMDLLQKKTAAEHLNTAIQALQ